jgi:alkylation response protein AidB-like acyl-CoA dehydrogenase
MEIRPIAGVHSLYDFHEVFFTDARVPGEALLGEEGNGWTIVQTVIHFERIGAARYEKAGRALHHIVELLKQRGDFDDPVVQADCAIALAAVEAARLLTYQVIDGRVKDRDPGANTYIARYAMIQADHAVANLTSTYLPDLLVQGGDGHLRAQFNSAITAGLAAGAAEVQLNMISGRYLQLPRGA